MKSENRKVLMQLLKILLWTNLFTEDKIEEKNELKDHGDKRE